MPAERDGVLRLAGLVFALRLLEWFVIGAIPPTAWADEPLRATAAFTLALLQIALMLLLLARWLCARSPAI